MPEGFTHSAVSPRGQIDQVDFALAAAHGNEFLNALAHALVSAPLEIGAAAAYVLGDLVADELRGVLRGRARFVQADERVFDLLEHGRDLEQFFARRGAVGVDIQPCQLAFRIQFQYICRLFVNKFGDEQKEKTGHEGSEHGQIKGGRHERIRAHGPKIPRIAHEHVAEKERQRGGQFSRAQKAQRRGGIEDKGGAGG